MPRAAPTLPRMDVSELLRIQTPGFQGVDINKFDSSKIPKVIALIVDGNGNQVTSFGGGSGSGGGGVADVSTLGKEATLQQARDLLTTLKSQNDEMKALLETVGTNTNGFSDGLTPLLTGAEFRARVPTVGAKTKSGSVSVTLASDQGEIAVATGLGPALEQIRALLAGTLATNSLPVVTPRLPQARTVGAAEAALTPTHTSANEATVHVVSGAVRRSIGGPAASGVVLGDGDSEQITSGEIAAYRLVREGTADAQVFVEYRTVG